jgi:hypothetical protein
MLQGAVGVIAPSRLWWWGVSCYNRAAWSLPTTEVGPTGLWEMASQIGGGQDRLSPRRE